MDSGAWQATVHEVAKSQTQFERLTHTHTHHVSNTARDARDMRFSRAVSTGSWGDW